MRTFLSLIVLLVAWPAVSMAETYPEPEAIERFVAIDNVCAWPNLTVLRDGTIMATIFNKPSHGLESGDPECWSSADGRFWKLVGTPARHEPDTIRMNLAAGLAKNGDLLVLCSGWTNVQQPGQEKEAPFRDAILRSWVSRSANGGRDWEVGKEFPPPPSAGLTELIPFGDIHVAEDGSLRASCYAGDLKTKAYQTWMIRSDDDGRTWSVMSQVSDKCNETHTFPLGGKSWLAAARHREVLLHRSEDDGRTWTNQGPVTKANQINGHLLKLADGRLLLSYGDRVKGEFGVLARLSNDQGKSWGDVYRIAHTLTSDCGYPSSVQRADGQIITAFYSKTSDNHNRYHMGVAIWTPPAK